MVGSPVAIDLSGVVTVAMFLMGQQVSDCASSPSVVWLDAGGCGVGFLLEAYIGPRVASTGAAAEGV